ncbi:YihY/virulence factor BrkB family protein [Tepidiforma thermophila]|uniref:Membrane protein n=1 Tax=Tepidiforma thermophila (strain KCTC 52669 / CGMCC 1.13589 / G233) TaxID=2761530 RepID=A0A2A9HEF8_TEPT2|nr:YihY/virulence factor BrkB family protein [Tepidiforma thermophila]PFG74188.1 membrane protein [Tepidiforma thermophila]
MRTRLGRSWRAVPGPVRASAEVVVAAVRGYVEDECTTYAAAIAYYAIFSIIPLGLITLSVFGLFADRQAIVDWVFEQVPLRETEDVRANVEEIVRRAQQFSPASLGFGLVFLTWASSGIFGAVRNGLNATAHAKVSRPFWRGKLIDILLVMVVGALVALSVAATAMARVVVARVDGAAPFPMDRALMTEIVGLVLAPVVTFTMFLVLYRVTPAARPAWRDALAGAALATLLFELAKNLVAVVIAQSSFSRDTAIYAGFGTALAFLLWMYVNGSILLFGAEFGRALRRRREARAAAGAPAPELLAAWSGHTGSELSQH